MTDTAFNRIRAVADLRFSGCLREARRERTADLAKALRERVEYATVGGLKLSDVLKLLDVTTKNAVLIDQMTLIEELRQDTCAEVVICQPNDEFGGPNEVVVVSASWTDFKDVRFEGGSLLECLSAAKAYKVKASG